MMIFYVIRFFLDGTIIIYTVYGYQCSLCMHCDSVSKVFGNVETL